SPEDLKARLQRARFAHVSDRISAAMNDDLAMATANFKPPPGPRDAPKPVATHRLRTSPQPSLWERFLFNERDGYDNTLMRHGSSAATNDADPSDGTAALGRTQARCRQAPEGIPPARAVPLAGTVRSVSVAGGKSRSVGRAGTFSGKLDSVESGKSS